MMNYEIFKEVVKEKFMDYMPEKFKGMELVAEPVEKVNVTLDGIILREEGRNISPTIYINDMYKKYQDCGDLEETLMAACDFMERAYEQVPVVDVDSIMKDANEKIVFQLINTEQNKTFLEQVPHREFQDLSIVYKVIISADKDAVQSSKITNEFAKRLGMSEEQLFKCAAENTRRLFPPVVRSMNDIMREMFATQMDEVVEKINHQNERYDALNKKLSEIETSKDDEEVRERLVKENQDKDALINSQQNELNKASSTIARLRDDIEKKDKEMKRMGDRIESLEDKIISVATENKNEAESKAEPQESQSVPQADKKMVDTVAVPQNMQAVANGIPVYYQIPVVDGTGNVVQRLPIERSVRKSSNRGVASLFARLSFKKKSRADIVKLVASGDLVPAQLVQIKSAIEKGLTESQLVELINNNISAEKMKEIIEIAVLENSMAD